MRNQLEYSASQKNTEPSFKNIGALKMPSIVVFADDLPGALDASACFARRGHKVQVALTPDVYVDNLSSRNVSGFQFSEHNETLLAVATFMSGQVLFILYAEYF